METNIDQYESEVPSSPATSSDNIKLLTQCCTKNQSSITHKVNSESLHPQWISKICLVPARTKPVLLRASSVPEAIIWKE